MIEKLTPGQVTVLERAASGVVYAHDGHLCRPFGLCRRQGLIRKGVITALGREALESARKAALAKGKNDEQP